MPIETYLLNDIDETKQDANESQKVIVNIFQRLHNDHERPTAIRDLHLITRPHQAIATTSNK